MALNQPLSATLLGVPLVLWRNDSGIRVWLDRCVHRGAKLSLGCIREDSLVCPYHGWRYGADGHCVEIPSQPGPLKSGSVHAHTYATLEHLGLVWVCLGTPSPAPPDFPEFHAGGLRIVHCGPYLFEACAPRVVENFLDVSHLPFVHADVLGSALHTEVAPYDVSVSAEEISADPIQVWQPSPDGRGAGTWVSYSYKVLRPLIARFTKTFAGSSFSIFLSVTPRDSQQSQAWMIVAVSDEASSEAELRAFQDSIIAQDIAVVESQTPKPLPLQRLGELHARADLLSVSYRRWLSEAGWTFGIT